MATEAEYIDLFYRFGVAILIGLMVGLQREYAHLQEEQLEKAFGGIRTFALLGLVGATATFLADQMGSPMVFAVIVAITGGLIIIAYIYTVRSGSPGMTTEAAALVTLMAGAICYLGDIALAAALAVSMTVLLALKIHTRKLARNITNADVYATLTFSVISLVVLPVLPRHGYGLPPFDVLVPYNIWLMVVFISGISFLGFLLIKVVGAKRGVALTGVLGGLASSTAVTLAFAQRSRTTKGLERPFAIAILLSWSVMFARIIVEVAVINPSLLRDVWPSLVAAPVVAVAYCFYLYRTSAGSQHHEPDRFQNPFELRPAITFALFYAVILLAANTARLYFGSVGIYVSSIASGLADVDAITLSLAELSRDSYNLDRSTAARGIVLAAVSNTVVKGGIVLALGSPSLRRVILPGLIATTVTAICLAFLI